PLRRHPSSTLFPYTTLFRSVLVGELNLVLRGWCNYFRWGNSSRHFSRIDSYVQERLALFDSKKRGRHGRRWGQGGHGRAWYSRLDRKSTRLNSSHSQISYAV